MENPHSPTEMTDSYAFFKSDGGEDPVPDPNSLTADFAPTPRCYGSYSSVTIEDVKDLKLQDVKDMTPEDLDRYVGQVLPGRSSALSSYVPSACREDSRQIEERLQQMKVCGQQKLEETLKWAADAALRASSWADAKCHAGYRPWWDTLPTERVDRPWRSEADDEYWSVMRRAFAN